MARLAFPDLNKRTKDGLVALPLIRLDYEIISMPSSKEKEGQSSLL
jgi:hypothetical protein